MREDVKERLEAVLSHKFTSSDEEDEGEPYRLRKKLTWETESIVQWKKTLDKKFKESLATSRDQQILALEKDDGKVSQRPAPPDAPKCLWAVLNKV